MNAGRARRAGDSIEDYCRACRTDRMHTIVVVDAGSQPLRVACGYCDSEHNYRGGPRLHTADSGSTGAASPAVQSPARRPVAASPMAIVDERERIGPPIPLPDMTDDLELLLRRIIREEAGVTPVVPADKWRGGMLVLRPGNPALQEKTWPIETFFNKVVMIRNRLRTLEQQINAAELPHDAKVRLQGYISGCYGSLTSFNVLFAELDDQFKGSGGD
jgi:hypothetical protein